MIGIKEVLRDNLCLGCGLCESFFGRDRITMLYDEKGYLRPKVKTELSYSENEQFSKFCPAINIRHDTTSRFNSFLGPVVYMKTGHAVNETIRTTGSSGGVITALATFLIETGKVDAIIQMGPDATAPIYSVSNANTKLEEVLNSAGSRYAPSATLQNIHKYLDQEEFNAVAVIGKPCDAVGVRNLINQNEMARKKILYLISFMCAGVPSIIGTKNLINTFEIKEKDVANLRYRGDGWPGHFKVTDNFGVEHKMSYNDSWGNELNKHLQFRCKICPDGTGEFADVTCADAWESSESGYPTFAEKPGQSLIVVRTKEGAQLVEEAIKHNYVKIGNSEVSFKEIEKMQPYQVIRKKNVLARLFALRILGINAYNYNRDILWKSSLKENPLRLIKNFIGTLKRLRK